MDQILDGKVPCSFGSKKAIEAALTFEKSHELKMKTADLAVVQNLFKDDDDVLMSEAFIELKMSQLVQLARLIGKKSDPESLLKMVDLTSQAVSIFWHHSLECFKQQ